MAERKKGNKFDCPMQHILVLVRKGSNEILVRLNRLGTGKPCSPEEAKWYG